jgi:hypothetical protein
MQDYDEVLKGLARRPSHETQYFKLLYDECRKGGLVEGANAVNFFKLSGLSQ